VRSATAGVADTAASASNAAQQAPPAGESVVTTDARLSDARPLTAGSTNYVQNRTSQQAATNFNIRQRTSAATSASNIGIGAKSTTPATDRSDPDPVLPSRLRCHPNAGYIRFGHRLKLHIGRNRESSAGPLNNGSARPLGAIRPSKKVSKAAALGRSSIGGGAQARARAGNVSDLKSWAASAVCFPRADGIESRVKSKRRLARL
jgi:hypothetical protein